MTRMGLLVDYEFCTGCQSCEMACKVEHELATDQYGIKVTQIGPWKINENKWQYSYVPVPTDQCNLCMSRIQQGKLPTCVQHCQAAVMKVGMVDSLIEDMNAKSKVVLYTLN